MAQRLDSDSKAESDVEQVEDLHPVKAEGGVPDATQPDQGSTTGTTPSGSFVGLAGGQDVGYAEETGAERRAQAAREASERGDAEGVADAAATPTRAADVDQ